MPDITMCGSNNCPLSKNCRRHEDSGTKPSSWQSYFGPEKVGEDCDSYWPVEELKEELD